MAQVYRIDNQGFFIEPVILGETTEKIPSDCVEEMPLMGLFKAQYVNGKWIEGMTQEEIDAIKNTPEPLSELDQIKKKQELMQEAIDDLIFGGGI